MASATSPVIFTPSKTVACRAAAKLFSISGRLSRAVRAARAELLDSGIKPTFFKASGTKKCRWRQRVESARMATSSFLTPRFLAIFSATEERETCDSSPRSAPRELAMRSISKTGFFVPAERTVQLAYPESCAYTDFAADSQRSSRVIQCDRLGLTRRRGHVFDGNLA